MWGWDSGRGKRGLRGHGPPKNSERGPHVDLPPLKMSNEKFENALNRSCNQEFHCIRFFL